MRTIANIKSLLAKLDHYVAHDLEEQDVGFKPWYPDSRQDAVQSVVQMAICMANGGGGSVVFGVADRIQGRDKAILGVPPEIDANLLKKAVYDQTDPKITPHFEEIHVVEGTGRLLLMQIYPGMPPYTDTSGTGSIRISTDCVPLTGTMRRKIGVETGEDDFTAQTVAKVDKALLSAVALEALRNQAHQEKAPDELLQLVDIEFLTALGLIKDGNFTRAALLLAGTEKAIRKHVPGHNWTFLQMISDTEYKFREDRVSGLSLSVQRIEDILAPFNSIETYVNGFYHHEYHTWPKVAVREALMNAFCHVDHRIAGPVLVKLFENKLVISNNGGFIAGITPTRILHRQPAARNPLLVEALTKLRLINRSNLGINRMFTALLIEGKNPPLISEVGDSVSISIPRSKLNAKFRTFVAEEGQQGRIVRVDALLLLHHLLRNSEIDTKAAANLCQRSVEEIHPILSAIESENYIQHIDRGRIDCWQLHPELRIRLTADDQRKLHRLNDWEASKSEVLKILKYRFRRREPGLSNSEIRRITNLDRNQVLRLMNELRQEYPDLQPPGRGKYARHEFNALFNAGEH